MFSEEDIPQKLVLESIPHRSPFLFVDRVIDITDDRVIAERTLKKEEAFFAGHYPQMPLMPGVLMCEAVFQAAGVFMSQKLLKSDTVGNKVPVLTRVDAARFRRMAFPGDVLRLEATFVQRLKDFYFFKGCAKKQDQVLVSLEFVLGLVQADNL